MSVQNKSYDVSAPLIQDVRSNLDVDVSFETWYIKPSADGRDAYTIMSPISKYYMTGYSADPEGGDILLGTNRLFGESDWQLLSTGVPNEISYTKFNELLLCSC